MKRPLLLATLLAIGVVGHAGGNRPGGFGKPNQPFANGGGAGKQNGMEQRMQNNPVMQKLQAAKSLPDLMADQQTRLTALENQAKQQMIQIRDEMKSKMQRGGAGGAGAGKPGGAGGDENQRKEMMQQLRPKMEQIGHDVNSDINSILTPQQLTEVAQKTGMAGGGAGGAFRQRFAQGGGARFGQSPRAAIATPTPLPTRVPIVTPAGDKTTSGAAVVNPFVP